MSVAKCKPGIQAPETWERWGWVVISVARRYGVTSGALLGHDRGQRLDLARRDLYSCLHGSGLAYAEIGRMLGRDHTTIRSAVIKEGWAA